MHLERKPDQIYLADIIATGLPVPFTPMQYAQLFGNGSAIIPMPQTVYPSFEMLFIPVARGCRHWDDVCRVSCFDDASQYPMIS